MSTDIYVVEKLKDTFTHSNNIYVDVMSKDASGMDQVRIHSEIEKYDLDTVTGDQSTYIVPIFTWES